MAVTGAADASHSSSSLDAVDSSLPAVATFTHTVASDFPSPATADQNSLLVVLDSTTSSELRSGTDSLENNERDSAGSGVKQNSAIRTEQTSRPLPMPVPRPRKSKQVAASNSSNLSQLAASDLTNLANLTSNQKPVVGDSLQSGGFMALSSTPMQSVQEARALFIQSTTPPIVKVNPRQSSLDQFDPLASGQLVIDGPSNRIDSVTESTEENLLKEWDLNFSQSTSVQPGVTMPSRVMVPPTSAVYMSMPNLGPGGMRMRYPSYGVGFPMRAAQPWMVNVGVCHQSSGPAAAMVTPGRALDHTNRCATLPSGLSAVQLQAQSVSQVSGSAVDVTGSAAGNPMLDWTANIDVLMRPHSMDLSSFTSTLSDSQQATNNQTWEKFDQ